MGDRTRPDQRIKAYEVGILPCRKESARFATKQLEDWFTEDYSGKQPFSAVVLKAYQKTVRKLDAADSVAILKQNKSLDFHSLKRELAGKYAVRVNMQYRIIFSLTQEGELEIIDIEQLTDYD